MCYMCEREGDGSWWSINMFFFVHQFIDVFTQWFIPSFIHPQYVQFSSTSLKTVHKSELTLNMVNASIMGFYWNDLGFVEYSLIFCCLILEVTTVGIDLFTFIDICFHRIWTTLFQVLNALLPDGTKLLPDVDIFSIRPLGTSCTEFWFQMYNN